MELVVGEFYETRFGTHLRAGIDGKSFLDSGTVVEVSDLDDRYVGFVVEGTGRAYRVSIDDFKSNFVRI